MGGQKVSYMGGMYGGYPQGQYSGYQPQNYMYGNSQYSQPYNVGQPMQQQAQQRFVCRPVSSYDEANASMIDLDGSMHVFVDLAHKCIYTKQILLDGSADIKTYKLDTTKQNESDETEQNKYVLQSDFNNVINSITQQINMIIGGLNNGTGNGNANVETEPNVPES